MKKQLGKKKDAVRKTVEAYANCKDTCNYVDCNPCSSTPSSAYISQRDSRVSAFSAKCHSNYGGIIFV